MQETKGKGQCLLLKVMAGYKESPVMQVVMG